MALLSPSEINALVTELLQGIRDGQLHLAESDRLAAYLEQQIYDLYAQDRGHLFGDAQADRQIAEGRLDDALEDFKTRLKSNQDQLVDQAKKALNATEIKSQAEATLTQAIQTATELQQDSQVLQADLKHSRQAVYWGYALTFLGGVIATACLMWLVFIPK
ncbi:hypothetical protein P4G57_14325 [Lacticaseibacillus paracasei]|uniref:hypothetical protein n=1 Tax=Lacticaseibacillus paracasei TaxID=1597 RepID=UPI00273871EB|nr:hypothetical protein [Lacticaseibacillus paracasei]MDP4467308.1 hypothetical protein [Lacticaseibacillus paracasei]